MKSRLNKIREMIADLNRDEIAALQQELTDIAPFAEEPSPEEKLLSPGHYFEERLSVRGNSSQQYLYERWYERDGLSLKHKGRLLYKGSLREYLASLEGKSERNPGGVFTIVK